MIHRGDWVPLLPIRARTVVVGILPLHPLAWGMDYILPAARTPTSLSVVEKAMPLPAWGALMVISAVLIAAGYIGRWPRPAIIGYWLCGCTYLTIAVGQMWALRTVPYWDGIRGPMGLLILAVAFCGMSIGYAAQTKGAK